MCSSQIRLYQRVQHVHLQATSVQLNLHNAREKKKKISHRQLGPLRGSSSPFQHFEPARVKPN